MLRIGRIDLPKASTTSEMPAAGALAVVAGAHESAASAALGVVSFVGPQWRSLRGGVIERGWNSTQGLTR